MESSQKRKTSTSAKELVVTIRDIIRRHIFFKDQRVPTLIAVWIMGTYIYDIFTYYGYLWINSPEKRCGKSLLEDLLSQFCHKPTARLSNVSEASIFRLADLGHTLILDEVESIRGADKAKYQAIMTVLNNGFQSNGKIPRVIKNKDSQQEVQYFNAFSPKVIAGINQIVDTIQDRAFKIRMVRKTNSEKCERLNLRKQEAHFEGLRERLTALQREETREAVLAQFEEIEDLPELASMDDRFKDIAEPLLAIASYLDEGDKGSDGLLPTVLSLLVDMAVERNQTERQEPIAAFVELAETLLGDKTEIFVSTEDLLVQLVSLEQLEWITNAKTLSTVLGRYGLSPRHDKTGQKRGYVITRSWLKEVKERYVSSPVKSVRKASFDLFEAESFEQPTGNAKEESDFVL